MQYQQRNEMRYDQSYDDRYNSNHHRMSNYRDTSQSNYYQDSNYATNENQFQQNNDGNYYQQKHFSNPPPMNNEYNYSNSGNSKNYQGANFQPHSQHETSQFSEQDNRYKADHLSNYNQGSNSHSQNNVRNVEDQMQAMRFQNHGPSPQEFNTRPNQFNNSMPPFNPHNNKMNNNNVRSDERNNQREPYQENFTNNRNNFPQYRENEQSSRSNFNEPTHLQQVGKPQVLAKTSSDGGSVAVFGVVAQVPKPPTDRNESNNQHQKRGYSQTPHSENSNRTQHLSPIIEHPNSPQSPRGFQPNDFTSHNRQEYNVQGENRYPSQPPKPEVFSQRFPVYKEQDRQRDVYRDEYTDSSGYGSTLTERSYDGPMQAQHRNNFSTPYQNQTPTNRNDYQSKPQVYSNDSNYPHQQQFHQPSSPRHPANQHYYGGQMSAYEDRSKQWSTRDQRSQQNSNFHQHSFQPENNIDKSQIKSVRSVKKVFDKPDSVVPMPPVSSSYGANQYNTRPLPPRPQTQTNDRNLSMHNHQPDRSSNNNQYNPHQQRPDQHVSNTVYHSNNSKNPQYYQPPSSDNNRQQRSPTVPQNSGDVYQNPARAPLPYYEPPPQHSQSMSNLDNFRPQQSWNNPSETRARNSYSSAPNDNDMVVGVRFEKKQSGNYERDASQLSPNLHPQSYNRPDFHQQNEPNQVPNNQPYSNNNPPSPKRQPFADQPSYNYDEMPRERRPDPMSQPQSYSNYQPEADFRNYPSNNRFSEQDQFFSSQQPQHPQHQGPREQIRISEDSRSRQTEYYEHEQRPGQRENRPEIIPQESAEENYVPDVVQKSYGLYNQSQDRNASAPSKEDWPEPPPNVDHLDTSSLPQQQAQNFTQHPYDKTRSKKSSTVYQVKQVYRVSEQPQVRQEPAGDDNYHHYRQPPSHPYDPTDDDSSDEVNVDAPTPPISSRNPQWGRERLMEVKDMGYRNDGTPIKRTYHQRPAPTGEKHHDSRQPGDGLNEDQYPPPDRSMHQQTQSSSRGFPPKKPSRNSLKQLKASNNISQQVENPLDNLDEEESSSLNHDHSKERARLARAGKIARKPPSRRNSSNVLPEVPGDNSNSDYEINVTSSDLKRQQATQPIKVHGPTSKAKPNHRDCSNDIHRSTESNRKSPSNAKDLKADPPRKNVITFKTPATDPIQKNPAHILPDVQEIHVKDNKMPPTYTGIGSTAKPHSTLTPDLLGLFTSSREDALRSAAKKQNRALHSVQAAVRLRRPDQSQSSKDSKRNENRDIYNNSKPKNHREDEGSSSKRHEDRGERDEELRRDRGRSSGRTKTRSPDHHDRDRDMNRDHKARKSDRGPNRPVSPYRGGRDSSPYKHAPHHRKEEPPYPSRHQRRSDEPEWVEKYRKKRATNDSSPKKRDWSDDPKWRQKKEFDYDQYKRDVKQATTYNSDFEQPVRKQVIPAKLLSKGRAPPTQRTPQGNSDWLKNLKEQNKRANRNR